MSRSKLGLPKEAEKIIARFERKLTHSYPDAEAFLFGSYANGTWLEDSDFDIVVVSKRFEGQSFPVRVAKVRNLAPKGKPFEILAYTPSEFREASRKSFLMRESKTYWRKIT